MIEHLKQYNLQGKMPNMQHIQVYLKGHRV